MTLTCKCGNKKSRTAIECKLCNSAFKLGKSKIEILCAIKSHEILYKSGVSVKIVADFLDVKTTQIWPLIDQLKKFKLIVASKHLKRNQLFICDSRGNYILNILQEKPFDFGMVEFDVSDGIA